MEKRRDVCEWEEHFEVGGRTARVRELKFSILLDEFCTKTNFTVFSFGIRVRSTERWCDRDGNRHRVLMKVVIPCRERKSTGDGGGKDEVDVDVEVDGEVGDLTHPVWTTLTGED